jgi:hypothetical protein
VYAGKSSDGKESALSNVLSLVPGTANPPGRGPLHMVHVGSAMGFANVQAVHFHSVSVLPLDPDDIDSAAAFGLALPHTEQLRALAGFSTVHAPHAQTE